MVKGYCMKCKKAREMIATKAVKMANGRKALKGKCKTCSTGMFKIGG